MDAALQELPKDAEERRVMQAPNRATTWSRSQRPRSEAMVGPRFEQTLMEYQVSSFLSLIVEIDLLDVYHTINGFGRLTPVRYSLNHGPQLNSFTNNRSGGQRRGMSRVMVEVVR